ncbi:hypothetical protein, variant [Phytophthora nicotianae P1976]|uniref:GST C-terminal domain-containing protein n=1 Tax=Phytophthora nicotianae P1976 TaxID=1317066 RepID=A0A080Z8G8_PHYNI|nr:hypothetical protein, variant [Phytophthora nicotianae P1976]
MKRRKIRKNSSTPNSDHTPVVAVSKYFFFDWLGRTECYAVAVYYTMFQDEKVSQRIMADPIDGLVQRSTIRLLFPALRLVLVRALKINEKSAERSWSRIEGILREAEKELGDGPVGTRFLAGDSFSAADISFCSHLAPIVLPPQHEFVTPYMSMDSIVDPIFRERYESVRRSKVGEFVLWCYKNKRPMPKDSM